MSTEQALHKYTNVAIHISKISILTSSVAASPPKLVSMISSLFTYLIATITTIYKRMCYRLVNFRPTKCIFECVCVCACADLSRKALFGQRIQWCSWRIWIRAGFRCSCKKYYSIFYYSILSNSNWVWPSIFYYSIWSNSNWVWVGQTEDNVNLIGQFPASVHGKDKVVIVSVVELWFEHLKCCMCYLSNTYAILSQFKMKCAYAWNLGGMECWCSYIYTQKLYSYEKWR